jgi:hypothetical protein
MKVFELNFKLMPSQPCKFRTCQIVLQWHQLDRLERFRTILWDFMLSATLFSSSPKKGYSQLLAKYRVVAVFPTPTASETAMVLVKRDDSLALPSLESVPTDMERRISLALPLAQYVFH